MKQAMSIHELYLLNPGRHEAGYEHPWAVSAVFHGDHTHLLGKHLCQALNWATMSA